MFTLYVLKRIYLVGLSVALLAAYGVNAKAGQIWATTLPFGSIKAGSIAAFDIDEDGKDEIFVPTSKNYDSNNNEIHPGGLICLEDDGRIKWTRTFPSLNKPDVRTGITYQTTSVTTSPFFADLDNDHVTDIIIGVGGDTGGYGDAGGVYALNADGSIKWHFSTKDISEGADGFPDGVYGAPVVFDIDRDGVREVIFNSWDHYTYILNGISGQLERATDLADTIWSAPKIADINGDGIQEILISADISKNDHARTQTGGIFHVLSADGSQNIQGFNQPVANPDYTMLRGKYEPQTLFSSPQTADLDGDGKLEIIYGTGLFLPDPAGWFIRVWNHDGTPRLKLDTQGKTFATTLIADINNDGRLDIVAATMNGYIHAWDNLGNPIFSTQINNNPIFSAPIAVDIDNNGTLEIFYTQGAHLNVINATGQQIISGLGQTQYAVQYGPGSPVVKDIDKDGKIDVLAGGSTSTHDRAVVYRWSLPDTQASYTNFIASRYQAHQSIQNLYDFTRRFYKTILNREPEPRGLIGWSENLETRTRSGADLAVGFIFSQEFTNRATTDAEYVQILYRAFFDREAEDGGVYWTNRLRHGASRLEVLNGFIFSQEFGNLCARYTISAI